jgi:uncharacterized protein YcbX
MWIFPIKSCGPIVVDEFECGKLGPMNGYLRDRVFMVVRQANNEFVTARTYPRMVLIQPKIKNENILTLNAPGIEEIEIDIRRLYEQKDKVVASIWHNKAQVVDCGDEIASWFSRFLLEKDEGFRLVFYPSKEPKENFVKKKKKFDSANRIDSGSLQDETSYMVMNISSFDDLNSKIEKPVIPLQFRPNFVIKGPAAWEEDNFKWVKVGNDAIFKKIEPCLRCIFTTIDPLTGVRDQGEQPLKTLRKFRVFSNIGASPVFGVHLGIRSSGKVRTGDAIYISE